MGVAFPLSPAPSGFVDVVGSTRGNVYLDGEQPTFNFTTSNLTTAKTVTGSWTVRDYYGNVVASGTLSNVSTLAPTPAAGGSWPRGWYRLYLTGTATDALFGTSLGVCCFAVVAADSRFVRPTRTGDPSTGGESPDYALKGFLGIGTSRNQCDVSSTANTNSSQTSALQNIAVSNTYWTSGTDHTGPDPQRPRTQYLSFPNGAVDKLDLTTNLRFEFATGAAAAAGSVTVATAAGTTSGIKVTLTQGSTVETYDNVAATVSAVMVALAGSALAQAWRTDNGDPNASVATGLSGTLANTAYTGVKQLVAAAYAQGVVWYEGPTNEPDLRKNPSRYANESRLFQAAVKAGNAGAKAMGPSQVDINIGAGYPPYTNNTPTSVGAFYRYLTGAASSYTSGGVPTGSAGTILGLDGPPTAAAGYLDGICVHDYNAIIGDLNLGRANLDNFAATLKAAGVDTLPRFQGEQGVITPIYGVFHPRRARWQMLQHLLLEQYGIPKERNNLWYDQSHGFWSFPGWWINGDGSVLPHAVMLRVMAEEVYGRPFTERLTFGTSATSIGERIFLGSRYTGTDGTSVVALIATSHLASATVTLQLVAGAGATLPTTLTYRDAFGTVATLTVTTDGKVVVPVSGEPTWVRLPAGVTCTVATVLDLTNRDTPNLTSAGAWGTFDQINGSTPAVNGIFQTVYDGNNTALSIANAPAGYVVRLERTTTITRVVIFAGMVWQSQAGLVDFDVDTSTDGGNTWTTQRTITKTNATSFVAGSDSTNTGTQRDTYYDEQWVFPVALTTPVLCNAVRINVRATSYGGEPDSAAVTTGGQGNATQQVTLTEVVLLGDAVAPAAVAA